MRLTGDCLAKWPERATLMLIDVRYVAARRLLFVVITEPHLRAALNLPIRALRLVSESGGGYLHNPLSRQTSLCSPPLFFLPPAHPSFFVSLFLFLQVVEYHFVRWFHRVGERVS